MSEEFDKDQAQDDQDDGALEAVLEDDGGTGDSAFVVTEEKQPLGKGTVAMFFILALCGAGTYFMYIRTGPQSASAAVDPKAQQVITKYMTDREKNVAGMKKMLRDTEAVVKQFLKYPSVQQVPIGDLTGNPFRITPPDDGSKTLATGGLDADREKKKREEERAAVAKAVGALQLQSVMSFGARKSCMVNNTLYTEGQQVEAFTIDKITNDGVIVRSGQYRFELRIQR
jgi:hypothetical protein